MRTVVAEAAAELGRADLSGRQLNGRQRRALLRHRRQRGRMTKAFLIALLPLSACALCGTVFMLGRSAPMLTLMCASPFAFLFLSGTPLLVYTRRKARHLEQACAATPPAVEGEPAACHVCGADLGSPELDAGGFVRCNYCAADNLVAVDVLARMGDERLEVVHDLKAVVLRESTRLSTTTDLGLVAVILLAVAAPLACLGTAYATTRWVWAIEGDVEPNDRYVTVTTPDGPCIARVSRRYDDGTAYLILFGTRRGYRGANYVPNAASAATFGADELVGRTVRYSFLSTWVQARVLRVYRPPLDASNRAVLLPLEDAHASTTPNDQINGLCFAEPQPDLVVLPWPETSRLPPGVHELSAPSTANP